MSAKRAAEALLELDTGLAEFADELRAMGPRDQFQRRQRVMGYIYENVMNTWTLTLAARSAGVTEQSVIAALLCLEPFRFGSACINRGEAAKLFNAA